eukprot:8467174-Lingulodinium_polyedra.AAC.1
MVGVEAEVLEAHGIPLGERGKFQGRGSPLQCKLKVATRAQSHNRSRVSADASRWQFMAGWVLE